MPAQNKNSVPKRTETPAQKPAPATTPVLAPTSAPAANIPAPIQGNIWEQRRNAAEKAKAAQSQPAPATSPVPIPPPGPQDPLKEKDAKKAENSVAQAPSTVTPTQAQPQSQSANSSAVQSKQEEKHVSKHGFDAADVTEMLRKGVAGTKHHKMEGGGKGGRGMSGQTFVSQLNKQIAALQAKK